MSLPGLLHLRGSIAPALLLQEIPVPVQYLLIGFSCCLAQPLERLRPRNPEQFVLLAQLRGQVHQVHLEVVMRMLRPLEIFIGPFEICLHVLEIDILGFVKPPAAVQQNAQACTLWRFCRY